MIHEMKLRFETLKHVVSWFESCWKSFVILLAPLFLTPLLYLVDEEDPLNKAAKCGYVMGIMAIYWTTEALPLPITSLIPVVFIPFFGIMTTDDVSREYFKETNMMFFSGLVVAIAVEHCNLHQRIAIHILLLIGTSPRRLMLGFMIPTCILSMWISNTATTAMMVPIADAVMKEMERSGQARLRDETEERQFRIHFERVKKMIFLSIAYSANTGGTGSLTGTGSNLVLKATLEPYPLQPINFASWISYAIVPMTINMILCWIWLQMYFLRSRCLEIESKEDVSKVKNVLRQQKLEMGSFSFHEFLVSILFTALLLLWFFRDPGFIAGWGDQYKLQTSKYILNCTNNETSCNTYRKVTSWKSSIDDGTSGVLIVILLFVLPAQPKVWPWNKIASCLRLKSTESSSTLVNWQIIHNKMPWGILLLLGGGFALSKATKVSGLSEWMGQQLTVLNGFQPFVIVLIICIGTGIATEITSNVATASILMPILMNLSKSIQVNPIYITLPTILTCSYAFMLPVATPPNAIVFAASGMKTIDMMGAGFIMNIICIGVNLLMIDTYGVWRFDLLNYPDWAK